MAYARPLLSKLRDVDCSSKGDGTTLQWNAESGQHVYRQLSLASLGGAAASHTHPISDLTDLPMITVAPTEDCVPIADGAGKIANGWLNTGSGNGLDADKLDGKEASEFALLASDNTFAGRSFGPDGSAAAPAYSFSSDPDTGMYRSGDGAVSWAANGALAMTLSKFGTLSPYRVMCISGGSSASPSLGWFPDQTVGLYLAANGIVGLSGKLGLGTTAKAQLHGTVSTILGAAVAANADADLGNSQVNLWLDEAGNKLMFKCKLSSGTIKTGEIALT